jgi:hypothetical protein
MASRYRPRIVALAAHPIVGSTLAASGLGSAAFVGRGLWQGSFAEVVGDGVQRCGDLDELRRRDGVEGVAEPGAGAGHALSPRGGELDDEASSVGWVLLPLGDAATSPKRLIFTGLVPEAAPHRDLAQA